MDFSDKIPYLMPRLIHPQMRIQNIDLPEGTNNAVLCLDLCSGGFTLDRGRMDYLQVARFGEERAISQHLMQAQFIDNLTSLIQNKPADPKLMTYQNITVPHSFTKLHIRITGSSALWFDSSFVNSDVLTIQMYDEAKAHICGQRVYANIRDKASLTAEITQRKNEKTGRFFIISRDKAQCSYDDFHARRVDACLCDETTIVPAYGVYLVKRTIVEYAQSPNEQQQMVSTDNTLYKKLKRMERSFRKIAPQFPERT